MQRHEDMIWRLKIGERLVKLDELAPDNLLPPILPIVLYNGEKPWEVPLELHQLYFPAPQELQQYQPRMRYWLLEERALLDQAQSIGIKNLVAAIFRLEFSSEPDDVRNILLELNSWMHQGSSPNLRYSMFRFACKWFRRHAPGYDFDDLQNPNGDLTMLAQRIEQWKTDIHQHGLLEGRQEGLQEGIEKGIQEGIQKGLQEGIEKGLQKGQAHSLCLLMQARFGSLSSEHRQRIEQADDQTLNMWMIRILNAQTPEEVLL